jgi:hypothetical protein
MDEHCVFTCRNLFGFYNDRVFEVGIARKPDKSGETMIVS